MKLGLAAVSIAAVLALGACNQAGAPGAGGEAPSAQASNPLDTIFPDLTQASYRAEAQVTVPGHAEPSAVTMIRAGRKMRMEFGAAQGGMVVINDLDANQAIIVSERGGQRMAMRMGLDSSTVKDAMAEWTSGRAMTPTGPCMGAGAIGTQWTMAPTEADPAQRTSCVTHDGILLKATKDGATTWETTSLARGPQDPALFAPPAGVTVMDMGNLSGPMRAAIERMKQRGGG